MGHRMDPLDDWLDQVGARLQWSQDTDAGPRISCYLINGQAVLTLRHLDRDGWDIFVPATREIRVDATLEAAARALGIVNA